jgi:hypothetical protein
MYDRVMRNPLGYLLFLLFTVGACSSDSVDSNEQARRAYLGLDKSISKSLALGFQGYNVATNANIPTQMTMGDASGTLTITGKVDQGTPGQAQMNLNVGMTMFSDGKIMVDDKNNTISVTYATNTDMTMQPLLSLKLNSSAGNTLTGTLMGDYTMSGDLKGTVTLDLQLTGTFSGTAPSVTRVIGSTMVTGTAVNSDGGMYTVSVQI